MYQNLIEAIRNKGIKKAFLAEKLGITGTSLDNKLAGRTRFYVDEALEVMAILGLCKEEIAFYFARSV